MALPTSEHDLATSASSLTRLNGARLDRTRIPARAFRSSLDHPMDSATLSHFTLLRQRLLSRRNELQAHLHAASLAIDPSGDVAASEPTTHADQSVRLQAQQIDSVQADRDLAEVLSVNEALKRLDDGVYGDCADCGQPVPLQRLLVQPAAARCAACQAAAETRSGPAR